MDHACQTHDLYYSNTVGEDPKYRREADNRLFRAAIGRIFAGDATSNERRQAVLVAAAMQLKSTAHSWGAGLKTSRQQRQQTKKNGKPICLKKLVNKAKLAIKKRNPRDIESAVKIALQAAQNCARGKKIKMNRVLAVPPKIGGLLPLIPALAVAGTIGSSIANIIKTIREARAAAQRLREQTRHNEVVEAALIGQKNGNGLYLAPYKRNGLGLYLRPYRSSSKN